MRRLAPAIAFLFTSIAVADNWPGWRGPNGDGRSAEKTLPTAWSDKQNIKWKIDLPEKSHAAPVIWGQRVYLAQALDAKGHKRGLWCIDRKDGSIVWKKEVAYAEDEPLHSTSSYCAATPVTDGERVIVSYGSAGLYCYAASGEELWHYDLGKLWHIWGNASSPILYRNLAILWAGPGERQFLLALDKTTGKKIWQTDIPGGKDGLTDKAWRGSWSTPIIATVNDHDELIVGVPKQLKAFDPATGKELWSCDGLGDLVYTSPAISKDSIVVAFSGFGGPALACKAGGAGDVTKTHRLWHQAAKNPQRIGSPIILGEQCWLIGENGVVNCFDLKTGNDLRKERVTKANTWSSLIYADGKFYVHDFAANTYVFDAATSFQEPIRNTLGDNEQTRSTLAISGGEIFIRTFRHLYCISQK